MKSKFKNQYSLLALLALLTTGCGAGLSGGSSGNSSMMTTYTQIERLGRPAINEGLVLSNDNLNAFNSIPPSLDLASSVPAVAAVLTEATAVLNIVTNLDGSATGGLTDPTAGEVAGQFLPDVTRISVANGDIAGISANADRTSNSTLGETAYIGCLSTTPGAPLLCGGRKIRDDVVDITLTYIAVGADGLGAIPFPVIDQVGYAGSTRTALRNDFPFLAAPY